MGQFGIAQTPPVVPAVQSDWTQSDAGSDAYIVNKPSLASVATSGEYADLNHKPTIPSTKADVGLGNVDNTSDVNKPVSTAQAAADAVITALLNSIIHTAVADLSALKALDTTSSTDYPDKQLIFVETLGLYALDRNSAGTNDNNYIVQPTTGSGRWLKKTLASSDISDLISDTVANGMLSIYAASIKGIDYYAADDTVGASGTVPILGLTSLSFKNGLYVGNA